MDDFRSDQLVVLLHQAQGGFGRAGEEAGTGKVGLFIQALEVFEHGHEQGRGAG